MMYLTRYVLWLFGTPFFFCGWCYPAILEIFPNAGLPHALTYWQWVCVLWFFSHLQEPKLVNNDIYKPKEQAR